MQNTKRLLAAVISVILGMSLLCGIGTVKTNASESDDLKELRIGSTDAKCIGHFDTTAAFDGNYNGYSMDLVYDYILYKNPDAEGYTSNILTDWYWDEDLCAAVIKLRQDVYFSDGDQMTGDDIVYTFERMGSSFMSGAMKAVMDFKSIHVAEDDGFTVIFPFYYAYGPWRDYLAGNSAVHNRSWEEDHGGASMDFDDPANICGSGPYRVAEYVVDAYTVFEKRDDWWMEGQQPEGTASFDRITIINYNDATTMMVEYEMHAIDVAFGITNSDYDRIEADPSLGKTGLNDPNFVAVLNLNTDSSPLSDKHLREVLAYGVDWDTVCTLTYGSLGTRARSTLPSDHPAFVDGLYYEYDPEKAKQIVEENDLQGTVLDWVATPDATGTVAEVVQGMLAEAGITINLEIRDLATATVIWMQPGTTIAQLDCSSFSNLGNNAHQQYGSSLATSIFANEKKADEKLNELLNRGLWSVDEDSRIETYKEVQQYIYDEIFLIPIAEWYSAYCYDPNVVASMNPVDQSMPLLRNIIPAEQ